MLRRLTPLIPLTPALAVIAFAALSAGAQGVASIGADAAGNSLADVQVGEAGKLLRVALICRDECRVGARSSGVFFLPEMNEALDIDLDGKSRNARRLVFEPVSGGTSLAIKADAAIVAASIKRCVIDEAEASCIDIEFAPPGANIARAAPPAAPAPAVSAAPPAADADTAIAAPILATASAPEGPPALREAPEGARLVFARFAPPERLAPPAGAAGPLPPPQRQASLIEPQLPPAPRPIIDRASAARVLKGEIDLRQTAADILSRDFDADTCARAEGRLKADAWALDAMVAIGFCEAIAGRLDEADGVFARLLAYTPDNYEALVGRALIAAKEGEPQVAGRYFQDALNALPPMAESDRIVETMARL